MRKLQEVLRKHIEPETYRVVTSDDGPIADAYRDVVSARGILLDALMDCFEGDTPKEIEDVINEAFSILNNVLYIEGE